MSPFRASLRLANKKAVTPNSIKQTVRQHLASRASGRELPTIPECPSPTCECAEMPPDLDIEMEKKLNGTMPAHSEHVLISTGQADWKSRIEDEKDTAPWGEVISNMKDLLGPKGRLHDVSWLFFQSHASANRSSHIEMSCSAPLRSRPIRIKLQGLLCFLRSNTSLKFNPQSLVSQASSNPLSFQVETSHHSRKIQRSR